MDPRINRVRRSVMQQWAPLCVLMVAADLVIMLYQCMGH